MSGGSLQLYEYPTDVVRLSCAKCGGGMREAGDFIGVFNHCALKSAIACSRVYGRTVYFRSPCNRFSRSSSGSMPGTLKRRRV